jgi:hypothetical protein
MKTLFSHKGQKPHKPRSFNRLRQNALMLSAGSSVFRIDNFRLARNKSPQKFGVFVIDIRHILGTEKTLPFLHGFIKH